MHRAKFFKAHRIGKQEVESLLIEFSEEIPNANLEELEESKETLVTQGKSLEFLLYHALPGGTYDWLLGEMLRRKASKLIVSYGGLDAS